VNILIVDDEIYTLYEIEFYVKKYGRFDKCVVCTNSIEALEQAEKNSFDIALLDIEMPSMNGIELAERLSNIFPDISLAFITAYNHYATEAFEVNAIDYILKPIREERLFKALDKLAKRKVDKIVDNKSKTEVYINTFGKFTVRIGEALLKWNRLKSIELLAYLLENRGVPIHKEKLCDLLWPDLDPQKALVNLQTTVYSIRKNFATYNCNEIHIEYSGHNYLLHIKEAKIDNEQFESLLKQVSGLDTIRILEQAIKLYTSDYLEEDGWIWAEPRKAMLRNKYIRALEKRREMLKSKGGKII
jgi:two-component SAPR family response regulator